MGHVTSHVAVLPGRDRPRLGSRFYHRGNDHALDRLAAEFEQASRAAVEEARRFNYNPSIWISMMNDLGAVAAAGRLLLSPDIQSGFERLAREGRVDLTIEFAVLNPKWDRLFGPAEREAAWWRLQHATRP